MSILPTGMCAKTCLVPPEVRSMHQDHLQLKLQMVESHYVGARNQTWVLCKSKHP